MFVCERTCRCARVCVSACACRSFVCVSACERVCVWTCVWMCLCVEGVCVSITATSVCACYQRFPDVWVWVRGCGCVGVCVDVCGCVDVCLSERVCVSCHQLVCVRVSNASQMCVCVCVRGCV